MAYSTTRIPRISPASAPQNMHKSNAEGNLPAQTGKQVVVPGLPKKSPKKIFTGGFLKKG